VGASLAVFSLKNLGIICGKITSQLDLAVSLIYTTYGPIWSYNGWAWYICNSCRILNWVLYIFTLSPAYNFSILIAGFITIFCLVSTCNAILWICWLALSLTAHSDKEPSFTVISYLTRWHMESLSLLMHSTLSSSYYIFENVLQMPSLWIFLVGFQVQIRWWAGYKRRH
jgi:hypothetical protein